MLKGWAMEMCLGMLNEADAMTDRAKAKRLRDWALKSMSAQRINAMIELAKGLPGVSVNIDTFDTYPSYLNLSNLTVDLRTLETHEHRREDYLTKLIEIKYDPDTRSARAGSNSCERSQAAPTR